MKLKNVYAIAFSAVLLTSVARAADEGSSSSTVVVPTVVSTSDGSSSVKSSSILGNKQYEDTHVLTDPNLRASDGSLSRYSFKGSFSYSGPPLDNLSAQTQPNPDKTVGNFAQKVTGNVMLNYRFDSTQSLSGGVGLIMSYPFAGSDHAKELLAQSKSGSSQYSANNPYLSYNVASRFDDLQMRNSFEILDSTQPVYTALGETSGLNYYNGLVYGLGTSKFALSMETSIYYWIFNRAYNPAPRSQGGDAGSGLIQQATLGLTPGVKYNFSSSLNLYSSLGFGWQNPRNGSGNDSVLLPRSPAMSLGMGWAYKRDVYLAPYVTTYPFSKGESWSETVVGFSTTFSLM